MRAGITKQVIEAIKAIKKGLAFGLFFLAIGISAQASTGMFRDPGDAFPWGLEIPFPWKGIRGTWATDINGQAHYFAFQVVKSTDGVNQLQVKQYAGNSCRFVAQGVGYEENRVVRAVMTGRNGAFNLTVHVFRQEDLHSTENEGNLIIRGVRTVTVMKVSPLINEIKGPERRTYQLYKISADSCGVCP